MARTVRCVKLSQELPGLDYPPFGGALGERIWREVSAQAWQTYVDHFKMIMNDYRLQGGTELATKAFLSEAEKYFFGEGSKLPEGYVPEQPK